MQIPLRPRSIPGLKEAGWLPVGRPGLGTAPAFPRTLRESGKIEKNRKGGLYLGLICIHPCDAGVKKGLASKSGGRWSGRGNGRLPSLS